MSGKYRKEKNCLNCGHQVEAHFCSYCGQENIVVKEDALHMVVHAVSDYFHFESKFFGTIKPLLLQPGLLTQKYVEGKRASYLHPIKLYIFISIVFFLVNLSGNEKKKPEQKRQTTGLSKDSINKAQQTEVKTKASNFDILGKINEKVEEEKQKSDSTRPTNIIQLDEVKDSTVAAYEKRQLSLPKNKRDGFIEKYFSKKAIILSHSKDANKKVEENLLHNIPKLMFILLPLFALLLKLVYIDKKKYYFEHLIYSFHIHSAIFLVVLISNFITRAAGYIYDISSITFTLSFFYIIWYIYQSLRTFYQGKVGATIFRFFLLIICYTILLTLTILIGLGVSAAMV
ncbi:hypothetical protein AQ505_10395 [Pedobacter sp. PACM 27299]|uniref:DUF3667 domain-containing protein n=1 Tax=Pedobacter sp. PACM 27299 TaxID=1727164 RepID=UPI000706958A|nr:DUF3667 domain-containing protein [Pedobacter sp. PACM 27299]ALL05869.1 hypothetical protein AQ505_10395 [Pedobacter sp. PACM 27299]